MRITKLSLTNFRSFKETQTIEFAPVTLLFGPNSVGKSSVLMSLFYLQEILENGECDLKRIEALGDKHVGGFENLVAGRDLNKSITIKVDYDKQGAIGSTYAKTMELLTDSENNIDPPILLQDQATLTETVSVEFVISWSHSKKTAFVEKYSVWINEEYVGSTTSDSGLKNTMLENLDFFHPLLLPADHDQWLQDIRYDSDEHLDERWADGLGTFENVIGYEFTDNFSSDGSISKLEQEIDNYLPLGINTIAGALPQTGKLLDTTIQHESLTFEAIVTEAFSELFVAPIDNLLDILKDSLCIGPLRVIPDALYQKNPYPKQKDWYSGTAAWDVIGRSATQVAEINHWLNETHTLNLGYSIRLKTTYGKFYYSGGDDVLSMLKSAVDVFGDKLTFNISTEDLDENPDAERSRDVDVMTVIELLNKQSFDNGEIEKTDSKRLEDDKAILWDDVNNIEVTPSDIGVGVSQLLPFVVASVERERGIIACEQPELHVHPRVQVAIGDLLTQNNRRTTFLIETHSEHLILRILRRIRETCDGELSKGINPVQPTDISIVYLKPSEQGVTARRLKIDNDGEFIDRWPNGFFAERAEELF